ncbi:MAG: transposase [Pedosphaera sp.]|nr:transposase [Pedosphaera sp.]
MSVHCKYSAYMRRDAKHPKLNLLTILKEVPDPRMDRRKLHRLSDVLTIAMCALLCGADSFEDMEVFGDAKSERFETFLNLPHGIPSHDTFNRVFAAMDPQAFLDWFMRWTQSLRVAVALDGKGIAPRHCPESARKWSSARGRWTTVWRCAN